MNDLKQFKHGQEGTHYACKSATDKANAWGLELECCACSNHKCQNPNPTKGEEQR